MYLFLFIIGGVIGSFLGVLADRLSTGRTIVKGRSYCESCKHPLSTFDLIPLFSFLFLKGRCRYCKALIPQSIFIIELKTGLLFAFLYYLSTLYSWDLITLVYNLTIVSCFIVIIFADYKYSIIPDQITFILLLTILLYLFFFDQPHIFASIITAFISFTFFLFLFLITKGKGMGIGDIKLVFVLGLLLGFPKIIPAFYLAFLTGAVVSIILIVWKKKKLRGTTIPFGPFLVLAAFISHLFGNQLIQIALQVLHY